MIQCINISLGRNHAACSARSGKNSHSFAGIINDCLVRAGNLHFRHIAGSVFLEFSLVVEIIEYASLGRRYDSPMRSHPLMAGKTRFVPPASSVSTTLWSVLYKFMVSEINFYYKGSVSESYRSLDCGAFLIFGSPVRAYSVFTHTGRNDECLGIVNDERFESSGRTLNHGFIAFYEIEMERHNIYLRHYS